MLVLLSVVDVEQTRLLKVVVSECRQGARLRAELVPWSGAGQADAQEPGLAIKPGSPAPRKAVGADELARSCEQLVLETRTQFAGGVRELVAVTPLLSKHLTRHFDHLQTGYAALLGQPFRQPIEVHFGSQRISTFMEHAVRLPPGNSLDGPTLPTHSRPLLES